MEFCSVIKIRKINISLKSAHILVCLEISVISNCYIIYFSLMLHFLKLYISLAAEVDWSSRSAQSNAFRLVSAFRSVGHRHADINPVPYAKEVNREE